ncbi:YkuJ family protein [Caldibacillus lycopersici]|uniref:YkuJ family protein n=1 Tax=Perspicuibacillus lycopersici TaxID=1325689 RepID=A0AAE3IUE8_9BACI|nr:YkuJ family protein [Perspicuibacillus lycopersici]MCU9612270.1 YkuJ family protein [Perspicuibacillus lycopersici]
MSLLEGILSRLKSMQESEEDTERFFEQNGVKKCKVAFYQKTKSFELKIYNEDGKTDAFQFDNIDMVAIEIFDLLQVD